MNELAEQSDDLLEIENTEETQIEDLNEETVETGEVEQTEETEEQKQSRSQNAKQRLRRKLREEQEKNDRIAQQLKEQQERFDALESKLQGVINPPAPRPTRVDFDTEEEYEDALYDWRNPKTSIPEQKTESKPVTEQRNDPVPPKVRENWNAQMDSISDKYDDFDEVISNPSVRITESMTLAIMESDKGGEIAYFLGKNPNEAARIADLPLLSQVREIDKLGNRFKSTKSNAPDPINPVKGSDSAIKDISKMTPDEYRAYRLKQMAEKL